MSCNIYLNPYQFGIAVIYGPDDGSVMILFTWLVIEFLEEHHDKYQNTIFRLDEPTVVQSTFCKPGWYFWDEVGLLGGGPYRTRKLAIKALEGYVEWLKRPTEVSGEKGN